MTHHWLAYAAVTALGAAASPAIAQDRAAPPPAWADPQGAPYPAPPMPAGPEAYDAPHAHPLPPGAYPGGPGPYPPHDMPHPGDQGSYLYGPRAWHDEGGSGGNYWYAYQSGGAPCGCPSYTWVPVPIETRYRYSAALRHVEEVAENRVIREQVVERKMVPVKAAPKYVKAGPSKITKRRATK